MHLDLNIHLHIRQFFCIRVVKPKRVAKFDSNIALSQDGPAGAQHSLQIAQHVLETGPKFNPNQSPRKPPTEPEMIQQGLPIRRKYPTESLQKPRNLRRREPQTRRPQNFQKAQNFRNRDPQEGACKQHKCQTSPKEYRKSPLKHGTPNEEPPKSQEAKRHLRNA